ncbi:DUF4307 domain-containing protein [Nesterenkonia natronophila]|uniref:DUF4307 domain-containing protein n=1 Tax=Nesterenkonia natronophila TaxID=2174932 RepID=A0A3A4F2T8_9MICC|nr:DUF4307 domain-containing protein [Nesterenkonia natronophila]RJN32041.1 DUF4307 domain-containing protein [Nesterenkonia natronophila]
MSTPESAGSPATFDVSSRYGPPRRGLSPRAQRVLIFGSLLVAFATTVWFTISLSIGRLDYQDVGYTIVSDSRAEVDFEVTKDFEDTAQCMLHALDDSYAIVGARIVTIGPHEGSGDADRSSYYSAELRTEHRAVTGIVDSCWLVD